MNIVSMGVVAMMCALVLSCKGGDTEGEAKENGSTTSSASSQQARAEKDKSESFSNLDLAAAKEIAIKYYLQPDSTGSKTQNKRIELEGSKLEIEEANEDGVTNREEREATIEEIKWIHSFVRARFAAPVSNDLDYPRIEVEVEVEHGEGEREVEEEFTVGKLPSDYLEFQTKFFKSDPFK